MENKIEKKLDGRIREFRQAIEPALRILGQCGIDHVTLKINFEGIRCSVEINEHV